MPHLVIEVRSNIHSPPSLHSRTIAKNYWHLLNDRQLRKKVLRKEEVKVVSANGAPRRVSRATGLHLPEALPTTRQMTAPGAVDATRWLNGLVADGALFRRWGAFAFRIPNPLVALVLLPRDGGSRAWAGLFGGQQLGGVGGDGDEVGRGGDVRGVRHEGGGGRDEIDGGRFVS